VKVSRARWNEKHKQQRKADPEQRKREYEYRKKWRKENPEKHQADVKRRIARNSERRKNDPVWRVEQNAKAMQLYHSKKFTIYHNRLTADGRKRVERYNNDPVYRNKIRTQLKNLRLKWIANPKGERQWLIRSRHQLNMLKRYLRKGGEVPQSLRPE
jgi:hypothetical protein